LKGKAGGLRCRVLGGQSGGAFSGAGSQLTLAGRGLEVAAGTNAPPGPSLPTAPSDARVAAREDALPPVRAAEATLRVEFFVQEGCAECLLLRRDYLPALAARYGYRLRPIVSDTHERATFLRLLDTLETCGVTANEPLYLVVNGTVLSGWSEVRRGRRCPGLGTAAALQRPVHRAPVGCFHPWRSRGAQPASGRLDP